MKKLLGKIKQALWREQWNIALIKTSREKLLLGGIDPSKISWLLPERKNGFYADPFLVQDGSNHYLFFEEYEHASNKGVISLSEISFANGKCQATKPKVVLQEDFHLSYPQVVKHRDGWTMTVEAAQSNKLLSYEAVDFPRRWSRPEVLLEGVPMLDPTFFGHEGTNWLFCSRLDKGENSALFAYYFDPGKEKWHEHKKNPIVKGLRSSRPAGAVFETGGKLFRPSQNSQGTYGRSIVLSRITELTSETYNEEKVQELKAERYPRYNRGTHTINFAGDFAVIDAKRFSGPKKYLDGAYSRLFKRK